MKAGVEVYINKLLGPIRKKFCDPTLKKLTEAAYPALVKSRTFVELYEGLEIDSNIIITLYILIIMKIK